MWCVAWLFTESSKSPEYPKDRPNLQKHSVPKVNIFTLRKSNNRKESLRIPCREKQIYFLVVQIPREESSKTQLVRNNLSI